MTTERYRLQADHFEIRFDDGRRIAPTAPGHTIVSYGGDLGHDASSGAHSGQGGYQTIEWIWYEDHVQFRLYVYIASDSANWWAFELRVYDGYPRGEWLFNTTTMMRTPLGSTLEAASHHIGYPGGERPDGRRRPEATWSSKAYACRRSCDHDLRPRA